MDPQDLCNHTKIRLIAAALGHQQCTKTEACLIPLPGTERVIAIGTATDVAKLLANTPTAAQPLDLDKLEALARAPMQATTAVKAEQALSDFHDEATPATVLQLVALARRAPAPADERAEQCMQIAHRWAQAAYCKALNKPGEDIDAIKLELRAALAHQATPAQPSAAPGDEMRVELQDGGSGFWPHAVIDSSGDMIARFSYKRDAERFAAAPTSDQQAGAVAARGIYVASRASVPARPQMWQSLRAQGWSITSTWIDEAGEGQTGDFTELWQRIHNEIAASCGVVLYAEESDFPLKGAFIECGIALGMGKPVAVVLKFPLMDRSMRPLGSWGNHPLVKICQSLDQAKRHVQSFAAPAAIEQAGTPRDAKDRRIESLKLLVQAYGPKSLQYDIEHPNDGLNGAGEQAGARPTESGIVGWQNRMAPDQIVEGKNPPDASDKWVALVYSEQAGAQPVVGAGAYSVMSELFAATGKYKAAVESDTLGDQNEEDLDEALKDAEAWLLHNVRASAEHAPTPDTDQDALDAKRYRWLRAADWDEIRSLFWAPRVQNAGNPEACMQELDIAIDASILAATPVTDHPKQENQHGAS